MHIQRHSFLPLSLLLTAVLSLPAVAADKQDQEPAVVAAPVNENIAALKDDLKNKRTLFEQHDVRLWSLFKKKNGVVEYDITPKEQRDILLNNRNNSQDYYWNAIRSFRNVGGVKKDLDDELDHRTWDALLLCDCAD